MLISGHPLQNPTSSSWLEPSAVVPSLVMGDLLLRQSQVRLWSQRLASHILGGEEFSLLHHSSSSCVIADGETFTVTGGWWGNWVTRSLWSMNNKLHIACPLGVTSKVCRYNISGFVEELPALPAKRFGHACEVVAKVILKRILREYDLCCFAKFRFFAKFAVRNPEKFCWINWTIQYHLPSVHRV